MNSSTQVNEPWVTLPASPASAEERLTVPELPSELCKHVLSYLGELDIAISQSVSRNWHMQPHDHLDLLTSRIRVRKGRVSSDELQAFVHLLGGDPTTPYAKTIIQLIKTLHLLTYQPWFHSELPHGSQLKQLDFSSTSFTDQQMHAIAPNLPNVRQLNFSNCPHLTDQGFLSIMERYPNVNAISFYAQVTDEGLEGATEFYHRNLRVIQLVNTTGRANITDVGLEAVAERCPGLIQLNLENLGNEVSDEGLIRIASSCPQLKKLRLKSFTWISDQSLIAIAENCPQLADLHLANLKNVSDQSLAAFIRNCPKLNNIVLKNLPKITKKGIRAVRELGFVV